MLVSYVLRYLDFATEDLRFFIDIDLSRLDAGRLGDRFASARLALRSDRFNSVRLTSVRFASVVCFTSVRFASERFCFVFVWRVIICYFV